MGSVFDSGEARLPDRLYVVPKWYACYTRSRHEKRVEEQLRERGIESYLPTAVRERQWKDRKKKVDWPLFPGYVFGRFTLRDVHTVLTTPGVSTIVRTNGVPSPVAEEELENIRKLEQVVAELGGLPPPVRPLLDEGDRVVVTAGPFEGIFGVVNELRGRRRVLVGLTSIGQGLEIEVTEQWLERLPRN